MMIITIMLFEFQYSSMIERKLAYNELNQLQAYYLAKAGARVGLLRVALYGRARRSPALKNIAGGIDVTPYLEQIWSLPLPPFPPEKGTITKMDKSDRDASEKVLEETKVEDGQYTHVITSESSKLNLNFLFVPAAQGRSDRIQFTDQPKSLFEYVGKMLITLLENFIKDSENPYEEYPNLKPEELVYNLMDWINPGQNSYAGGAKDSFYEQQKPSYKAKRNRFYTVDELKLVKGIDDHLYTKLRPYVTVYSYDGKINLNNATPTIYRALYRDFTEDDIKRIIEERDKNNGWTSEKAFVDFVTNTLGRSGFKTYYSDEANYPFTIASQSFLIEASGIIKKSKSSIMKTIRIGVALTAGKGGTVDSGITDQASCQKAGKVWNPIAGGSGQCFTPPTTDSECLAMGAGAFVPQQDGTKCCILPNTFRYCTGGGTTPGQGSQPGTGQGQKPQKVEASAMKILYWSES